MTLDDAIRTELLQRGRLVWRDDTAALIAHEKYVSHFVHAALSALTIGLWAFIWLACYVRRWRHVALELQPSGEVSRTMVRGNPVG